ncbi:hypothetical protein BST97_02880 [Nonlabens spongiae]|uniref:Tail specific protease domain-containing protein n=1 Tax=Nonlabens spongiae TaxID=331648 RepID=A0A1W6MHF6_9FLAO|nr:S41 family peptidase [Nonlabens spongiae]ARN77028.1 hypothetical protein BST97_02880 [Nonlabens spongiae]
MRTFIYLLVLLLIQTSFAQTDEPDQPVKNFDKLWNEFNDRYANFDIKNVDWDEMYRKYRPLVNFETSNDSLFTVCSKMLLELEDGHINLIQYGSNGVILNKLEDGSPSEFLEKFPAIKNSKPNIYQLLQTTDHTLQQNGFVTKGASQKGSMEYSVSKQFGYFRILSMGNMSLAKYRRHIDKALTHFESKEGVIIDLRFNGGGDDKVSLKIASRFADKERIGFYKRKRKKGTSSYENMKKFNIKPAGKKQFVKPIILLTSDLTASAAEVFTMIMNEFSYVTIIGDHTNGIFSDMYDFKLHNGWLVTLSNEQYFSASMVNYEGSGIPPDIKLLNQHTDIFENKDSLIIRAIAQLKVSD